MYSYVLAAEAKENIKAFVPEVEEKSSGEPFTQLLPEQADPGKHRAPVCAIHRQRHFCMIKAVLRLPKRIFTGSPPFNTIKYNRKAENK